MTPNTKPHPLNLTPTPNTKHQRCSQRSSASVMPSPYSPHTLDPHPYPKPQTPRCSQRSAMPSSYNPRPLNLTIRGLRFRVYQATPQTPKPRPTLQRLDTILLQFPPSKPRPYPKSPPRRCCQRSSAWATQSSAFQFSECLWAGEPQTPNPAPQILHPTPYTLHPSPYTLHPTPSVQTLHPTP